MVDIINFHGDIISFYDDIISFCDDLSFHDDIISFRVGLTPGLLHFLKKLILVRDEIVLLVIDGYLGTEDGSADHGGAHSGEGAVRG